MVFHLWAAFITEKHSRVFLKKKKRSQGGAEGRRDSVTGLVQCQELGHGITSAGKTTAIAGPLFFHKKK